MAQGLVNHSCFYNPLSAWEILGGVKKNPPIQILVCNCINNLFILQVVAQVAMMDENIAQLQACIQDKTGPMMLAQTRLEIRTHRPSKELVRDPVQYGLIGEVEEITASIQNLEVKVAESKAALKDLLRNQVTLEEDIAVKTKSLFIEQDQCMALRNQLSSS